MIVGGGAIAAEMGHVFSAFGTDVTILQRSARLLMAEDVDVSTRCTELLAHRMHVRTDVTVTRVAPAGGAGISVDWTDAAGDAGTPPRAEVLLVATGRIPNTDRLDAVAGGLDLDEHGHLVVDEHCRTNVDGVWALGDVANHFQLKHLANAEARVVRHNLAHPDALVALGSRPRAARGLHVAAGRVGRPDRGARHGHRIGRSWSRRGRYSATAYGWALEDSTSFVKVIADAHDRTILGAHIIGPEAALLLQPLLQAMMLGQTADQVARDVLYIHPALTEVVEQALLEL